jgi:hemerythrin-like domain-containing protein
MLPLLEVRVARKTTGKQAAKRPAARKRGPAAKKQTAVRQAAGSQAASRKTAVAARKKPATPKAGARKTSGRTAAASGRTAARGSATRQRRSRPAPKAPSVMKRIAAAVRGTVAGAAAAVPVVLPWSDSSPDAIQLLEEEHRRFEDLLRQGEETTERAWKGRRELLETLRTALEAHELMEEKVLYPALQAHPEAREVVLEGYEEHHVADVIIGELREVAASDEQWGAKFAVLKENIEHHIQEEEGEMFRVARGIFSREELQALASEMLAVRKQAAGS